jgi:hypothetical protein
VPIGGIDIFVGFTGAVEEGSVRSNTDTVALDDDNLSNASGGYAKSIYTLLDNDLGGRSEYDGDSLTILYSVSLRCFH